MNEIEALAAKLYNAAPHAPGPTLGAARRRDARRLAREGSGRAVRGLRVRVLVGCESSGVVRDAFSALGHDAMSCDLLPSERPGQHYRGDVRDLFEPGRFDLFIAHPECTHLSVSGARHFAAKRADGRQQSGIDFFMEMVNAPFEHIAVENPISIMSSIYRKPDQIIQPWQYGHGETKATCLWLKNLPTLVPTDIVGGAIGAGPPHAAWSRPVERAKPHLRRDRRGDGRSMVCG